jgi:hypothetical protein
MSRLSFEFLVSQADVKEAIEAFEFIGGNSEEAIRVAINKTAPRVRTIASSRIREQVRLSASYVGQRLTIRRATRSKLSGAISTPSQGLLLSRFSTDSLISGDRVGWIRAPETPPRGITVKVKPSGAPKRVTGDSETKGQPFYIVLNKGQNVGIAARLKAGSKRNSVKVFSGPSLSQVFNTVKEDVTAEASAIYSAQLLDAVRFLTLKRMPAE